MAGIGKAWGGLKTGQFPCAASFRWILLRKVKIKFPACSMLKLFTKNGNFITTSIISTKANNLTPPFDSYQKIMYKIK